MKQPDPASGCKVRPPTPCDYDKMADLAGQLGYSDGEYMILGDRQLGPGTSSQI